MTCPPSTRSRTPGLTLIELLVVIAILAVRLGLLRPIVPEADPCHREAYPS